MVDTAHDELMIRCPRLGGDATFKFCRVQREGLPCRALPQCWQGRLDALDFLRLNYTPDELRRILAPKGHGRVATMIEAADRARKETQG
jgi:hypothetical protein